jgi:hypothetical protein
MKSETVTHQTIHNLDTILTFEDIMKGGKFIDLPSSIIPHGDVRFDYVSEDVDLSIAPAYLKANTPQIITPDAPKLSKRKLLLYAVLTVAALMLYFVVGKRVQAWLPLETYPALYNVAFWAVELTLLGIAFYMAFKSESRDAFSWSGVALASAFSFAVRWKLRTLLSRKWGYFANHYSAPYFILFLALLLTCVVMLMLKMDLVAEKLAVIGYFLFVTGVLVEFVQYSRAATIEESK